MSEVIELDEGFFSTVRSNDEKSKPLKRGRGSQKKTKVLVMVESVLVEGKTTKKGNPRKVGIHYQLLRVYKWATLGRKIIDPFQVINFI